MATTFRIKVVFCAYVSFHCFPKKNHRDCDVVVSSSRCNPPHDSFISNLTKYRCLWLEEEQLDELDVNESVNEEQDPMVKEEIGEDEEKRS